MAVRNLSSRILVFEQASDMAAYVAAGGRLERFQEAFLAYATSGQTQWIRGVGDVIGSAETTQVAGAPAGGGTAGYTKIQVTAASAALKWATHNRRIVHVEVGGSLAALAAADWKDAAGAFLEGDFYLQNHSGGTLTFNVQTTAGQFAGFVELGGDEQVTGFAVPDKYLAHVFVDKDGFVQITLSGEAVTQAELNAGLNLKQDAASRVTSVTTASTDAQYPSAKLLYDHVLGRRGAFVAAAVTASTALTAWDQVVTVDAGAGDVVLTLPSVTSQDGEIVVTRIDNTANVVAVQAAAGQALLGVPAGTTHITLLPGGALRMRAVSGSGAAKVDWSSPRDASRLWTPTTTDLPSILGFYDALSISGLTDGSDVGAWADSSGAGRNLSQATAANKATYRATGLNGMPAVEAKSSATVLDSASFVVPDSATFVTLLRAPSPVITSDSRIGGFQGDGGGGLSWRYMATEVNLIHTGIAHLPSATTDPVAGAIELRGASFDDVATANNVLYHLNGAADGVQSYTGDVGTPSKPIRLFNESSTQAHTGLRISAFAVCTGVLAALDRQRLEGYIAWRFGVQATNLPSGHPFRGSPPLLALVQY